MATLLSIRAYDDVSVSNNNQLYQHDEKLFVFSLERWNSNQRSQ